VLCQRTFSSAFHADFYTVKLCNLTKSVWAPYPLLRWLGRTGTGYLALTQSNKLIQSNKLTLYKGKAIPLQALTGPDGSRRLRLQDFKTVGT
jgi:hypothetical protein